jgi:hypothetical protein|tara:strand:+ start:86 stop:283 length:198 start_codon:yes stop_codon:yes gene_type:complete
VKVAADTTGRLGQENVPCGAAVVRIGNTTTTAMAMEEFITALNAAARPVQLTFDWNRTWMKRADV